MEAFSLLKYWRGGGGGSAGGGVVVPTSTPAAPNTTTTILTAVTQTRDEDSDSDTDNDDGPFFDLEFAIPDQDEPHKPEDEDDNVELQEEEIDDNDDGDDDEDDEDEGEREFNFTVSSASSTDRTDDDDQNLTLSPSDDLFFKGKLVPIEASSMELLSHSSEEPNSKPSPPPPQFPVSLLKSATKFRVFMSGLKKSKSNANVSDKTEQPIGSNEPPRPPLQEPPHQPPLRKQKPQQQQGKLFTVKFKVEEVPIVSLFTRDNSSRISTATNKQKPVISTSEEAASEEKRFSKEVMQKYLKMVKPLYVRVSKRYGEKVRLSGHLSLNSSTSPTSIPAAAAAEKTTADSEPPQPATAKAGSNVKSGQKPGHFPAGLRVVCKHLGKSRSASSAVAAAPSGSAAATVVSQRRDDSLLQQQDGIQSAILHCKRSFNASRDSDANLLPRCVSDPSNEKSVEMSRKSSDHSKGFKL